MFGFDWLSRAIKAVVAHAGGTWCFGRSINQVMCICVLSPVRGTLLSGIAPRTVQEHDEESGTAEDEQG